MSLDLTLVINIIDIFAQSFLKCKSTNVNINVHVDIEELY